MEETAASRISRRRAAVEVACIALFAAGYLVAEATGLPKRWLIPPVVLAVLAYLAIVIVSRRESPASFGLGFDNFLSAAVPSGLFTAAGAAAMVAIALYLGKPLFDPELAILLPLYPLYGIVQQLVFQGVLHRRLDRLVDGKAVPVLITTASFALVHAGDIRLVILTAVAGLVWSIIFSRRPNVIALGLSHGILASLAYPVFIGINPLDML